MDIEKAVTQAVARGRSSTIDKQQFPLYFIMNSAEAKGTKYLFTGDQYKGWMFGYTTYRLLDGTFAAVILKPGSTMNDPILGKVRWTSTRRAAKAQAIKWTEQTKATASGRPPANILK